MHVVDMICILSVRRWHRNLCSVRTALDLVKGKPGAPFQPSAKPFYKLYLSPYILLLFCVALFIMGVGRRVFNAPDMATTRIHIYNVCKYVLFAYYIYIYICMRVYRRSTPIGRETDIHLSLSCIFIGFPAYAVSQQTEAPSHPLRAGRRGRQPPPTRALRSAVYISGPNASIVAKQNRQYIWPNGRLKALELVLAVLRWTSQQNAGVARGFAPDTELGHMGAAAVAPALSETGKFTIVLIRLATLLSDMMMMCFNMMCMCTMHLGKPREGKRDRQGELRAMVYQSMHAFSSTYNTSMKD